MGLEDAMAIANSAESAREKGEKPFQRFRRELMGRKRESKKDQQESSGPNPIWRPYKKRRPNTELVGKERALPTNIQYTPAGNYKVSLMHKKKYYHMGTYENLENAKLIRDKCVEARKEGTVALLAMKNEIRRSRTHAIQTGTKEMEDRRMKFTEIEDRRMKFIKEQNGPV